MKKITATLTMLPICFAASAHYSAPTLSSRSGFIISGIVAVGILLMIVLASGPNNKVDNEEHH